ncbi:hypothetical protein, partial [Shigella sonnei]
MCISSPETNSWSVIYRKNSGEDINITSLTFKNSLLAARTLMVPENYMICILRNGERVRRWDREILAGSNRWYKCSPDNFEILGKHAQKRLNNILKNCLLSAAAQLHRPLSWLCFQMYAILLLQLMDHRKQVTRLGIPFRPEHPYETHARLLLL